MNAQVLPLFPRAQTTAPKIEDALESTLIKAAARGDLTAFERIFSIYHRRVYSFCRRALQNPRTAEVIVEKTFVRLFAELKSGDETDLTARLRRLAIAEMLEFFAACDEQNEQFLNAEANLSNAPSSFINQPLTNFDCAALETATASLPFDFRLIFVLHDFERLSHREIAALLKIAVETSQTNLRQARQMLRATLAEQK